MRFPINGAQCTERTLTAALKKQAAKTGCANPLGHPEWIYVRKKDSVTIRSTSWKEGYRHTLPTWRQIIQRVQRRYRVKW